MAINTFMANDNDDTEETMVILALISENYKSTFLFAPAWGGVDDSVVPTLHPNTWIWENQRIVDKKGPFLTFYCNSHKHTLYSSVGKTLM